MNDRESLKLTASVADLDSALAQFWLTVTTWDGQQVMGQIQEPRKVVNALVATLSRAASEKVEP